MVVAVEGKLNSLGTEKHGDTLVLNVVAIRKARVIPNTIVEYFYIAIFFNFFLQ